MAYALVYPFSLCCLVVVKLLVLDRLMEFCKLDVHTGAGRWLWLGRAVLAAVVLGSAIGWCVTPSHQCFL